MNSNSYMTLSGNFKPQTGISEEYTIRFANVLAVDKKFGIQVGSAGRIYFPGSKYPNSDEISVKKKAVSFTFNILWINEQLETNLSVNDSSGAFGTVFEKINIASNKCILTKDLSDVKLGNVLLIKSILPLLASFSAWDVVVDWKYNGDLLVENGECKIDKNTRTISLPLKAMKMGKVTIAVVVDVANPQGDRVYIKNLYKGSLEFDIKNPYSVYMDDVKRFACKGSVLVYRINGLGINSKVNEIIFWKFNNYGKLITEQGKNPASFELIKDSGLFTVSVDIRADNQIYSINSNDNVWVGKPTLNSNVNVNHKIESGGEITLKLSEFDHYSDNIKYSIESGNQDMVDIKELSVNEFKVKSYHPKILNDKIVLKFTAINICGEVSNIHTIIFEAAPGSSFEKSLELKFNQNHLINFSTRYNLNEYGGNIDRFEMYFTFTLMRKVQFSMGIYASSSLGPNIISLFDAKGNKLKSIDNHDSRFRTDELQLGQYYIVVDVQNDVTKEDALELFLQGGATGGDHPTNPYPIDANADGFEFKDQVETNGYYKEFKYINEKGETVIYDKTNRGNEVFYSMKLISVTQLLIDTVTGSTVNTEFHIMKGKPYTWNILYHDEGRNISNVDSLEKWEGIIRWKKILGIGEYVFVFNGVKWGNAGQINGTICSHILGRKIKGVSFEDFYELGHFSECGFSIKREAYDILAHIKYGVKKLFFHFSMEKNINLFVQSLSGEKSLPIELYDFARNKIVSSVPDSYSFEDLLGGEYYCAVSLIESGNDSFSLNMLARQRGFSALGNCSYNMGIYNAYFTFVDSIDTADGNFYDVFRYKDENGDYPYISVGTNHFYYKITLLCDMELTIDADWHFVELHLLQGEPYEWRVLYHRMPVNNLSNVTPMKIVLLQGEYKLVFNRVKLSNAGVNNGPISFAITGNPINDA